MNDISGLQLQSDTYENLKKKKNQKCFSFLFFFGFVSYYH